MLTGRPITRCRLHDCVIRQDKLCEIARDTRRNLACFSVTISTGARRRKSRRFGREWQRTNSRPKGCFTRASDGRPLAGGDSRGGRERAVQQTVRKCRNSSQRPGSEQMGRRPVLPASRPLPVPHSPGAGGDDVHWNRTPRGAADSVGNLPQCPSLRSTRRCSETATGNTARRSASHHFRARRTPAEV